MLAMEFVHDRSSKEPAADVATAVVEHAAQNGLILLKAGVLGNCIRVLVALVATDAQIDEALDILDGAVAHACTTRSLARTSG
jgi:4-aminobutyrate aminotransferase / (S)-3-amino-2-methylpropionate transaminase / 5-aminovalerate transaminase